MSKNVLFLVTGMTPQIITETVWALACDPNNEQKWIPDEIYVLSTEEGLTKIRSRLFTDGIFNQFKSDYPELGDILFNESQLHVITDAENRVLSDLRTPNDNEFAANAICQKIREFTSNDQITLHVSIAGGRKTMGFYAGYALSLYGRAQDRMSHVLVDEKFEKDIHFFYPTQRSDAYIKNEECKTIAHRCEAQIWLAEIPFVRLKDAVKDKHQLKREDSFSQTVDKINASFNDVELSIDLAKKSIRVNNRFEIIDLPPRELAMLYWFADLRKNGGAGVIAPRIHATSKNVLAEDAQYLRKITSEFVKYYQELKNPDDEFVVDKKLFEGVKSKLKDKLESALGLELAAKMAIKQDKREQPFYLDIQPKNIEIIDSFNNKL